MKTDSYMETLMSNDELSIIDFIKRNGKPQKPVCPIYFTDSEPNKEVFEDDRKEAETNEI